ncbi:hypothetical protein ACFL0M_02230 [Thermodesulfobacteriota bacterium]
MKYYKDIREFMQVLEDHRKLVKGEDFQTGDKIANKEREDV